MEAQMLSNLVAYSAQAACIVGLAGLLSMLLRIDTAAVRYGYWRGVLLFCLALPWLQGRAPAAAAEIVAADTGITIEMTGSAAPAMVEATGAGLPWLTLLGVLLGAGIVLRSVWLGAALIRLRHLRRAGVPAPADAAQEELQRSLGTRAEIRYVSGIGQPVTFGLRRPVVLLPEALSTHPPEMQRAVLCHELFHVRRRDWLWLMAEELIRAALWFHPAIWWLVSRVQLAREEVVDELTVRATRRRRAYIQALMAFADGTPEAATAAFSRRNHLFRRMVLVSKEGAMSARRVALSCAVMALMVGGGGWYATGVFPLVQVVAAQDLLTTPGPLEQEAHPITPENPIPRRIFSLPAYYPPEGLATQARGGVTLRITLNEAGRVAEVRRVRVSVLPSGDPAADAAVLEEAFLGAAVEAVRRWQYEPPAEAPLSFDVVFSFMPGSDEASATQGTGASGRAGGGGGAVVGVLPAFETPPVRVGGGIREPVKLRHAPPVYPQIAQQARVTGVVILELTVLPDGRVGQARVLRSIPLLDQAALDAVMQWQFTPTLLNGQPVPVVMTVTVNFTLN
jgi:TonB family protein